VAAAAKRFLLLFAIVHRLSARDTLSRMPPIIAYHVIFSTYGFWLPNDPRGSGSSLVWARHLRRFGPPTKTNSLRSVAAVPHDRSRRLAAKEVLLRPALRFNGRQALSVAQGFAEIIEKFQLPTYALVVMPDHVHMVIARGRHKAEEWAGYFKRAATRHLRADRLHPFDDGSSAKRVASPWGDGGWKVYLHTAAEILRAIRYVEENPIQAGLPKQHWSFVTPYVTPRGRGG
jgi:REP element-mobilizing transposase RayT